MGEGTAGADSEDVEGDDASDERDLFGEERPTTVGLVASSMGVLRVELAPDRIGGFGLAERCTATDIATDGRTVVVGTDEDVLVDVDGTGAFTPVGFGPTAAVGIDDGWIFAAAPTGQISRASVDQVDTATAQWDGLGTVSGPRRFDGSVLAAAAGVVRTGDDLDVLGPDDVNAQGPGNVVDVARTGSGDAGDYTLFAASDDGIYRLSGDTWHRESERPVQRVSFEDGDGFAVTDEGQVLHREDDSWVEVSLPDGKEAFDVASGESLYVITADGELLIGAESAATSDGFEGWRMQPLGVRDVTGFVLLDG